MARRRRLRAGGYGAVGDRSRQRGEVAYDDVTHNVAANRPIIVVAGTGRTADQLAAAVDGGRRERAAALVATGFVRVAGPVDDPGSVAALDRPVTRAGSSGALVAPPAAKLE